ncbi:MAG: beta-Ala-His dipeptidase, partial [Calditrichia bacterium]|nr:beta-Ala-His dipeptidase [Calditrichia bacterium]
TGLTGANELDPSMLEGKILLNIDSEEEGALYIGCAGGKDTEGFMDVEWENAPAGYSPVLVKLNGLRGGHSGLDIAEGRGNAIVLGNRFLWNLSSKADFYLFDIDGGSKHNAIPREFDMKLMVKNADLDNVKKMADEYQNIFLGELGDIEPKIKMAVQTLDSTPGKVFSKKSSIQLFNLLYSMPHGVKTMSRAVPGLVETSTNLAIIKIEKDEVSILTSQRSSVMSSRDDMADKVSATLVASGARAVQGNGYPAWEPNPDSALLAKCKEVYKNFEGKEPVVKAIHAGLECGIIGDKFEGMDMISFGPDIQGAHSPEERVNIKSWERVWSFLLKLLKDI